jgi:hypothetical protein
MSPVIWTQEQDDLLRRHYRTALSTHALGTLVGKSRQAVIGRAYRLGLSVSQAILAEARERSAASKEEQEARYLARRARRAEREYEAREARRAARKLEGETRMKPVPPDVDLPPKRSVRLIALRNHHCRAIVGRDRDGHELARYCGRHRCEGSSYCEYHHLRYHIISRVR